MNIKIFGQKCININKFMSNILLLLLLTYNNNYLFFLSKNKSNIISFNYQGFFEIIYKSFSIFSNISNKKIYNNNVHI